MKQHMYCSITNIFIDFDKYVSINWFSFNLCILFYVFKNILRKIPQTSLDCQNDLWTKKKKKDCKSYFKSTPFTQLLSPKFKILLASTHANNSYLTYEFLLSAFLQNISQTLPLLSFPPSSEIMPSLSLTFTIIIAF